MSWNKGFTKYTNEKLKSIGLNISKAKRGKNLSHRKIITYKCKTIWCNTIIKVQPSRIYHYKYCSNECKKSYLMF